MRTTACAAAKLLTSYSLRTSSRWLPSQPRISTSGFTFLFLGAPILMGGAALKSLSVGGTLRGESSHSGCMGRDRVRTLLAATRSGRICSIALTRASGVLAFLSMKR